MADVAMPRLSDSMEEGTILRWLKSDGDEVAKGDELVEIETDKANMTYEADEAGVLSIVASEGDTLPVGELIAKIGEAAGGGEQQASGDDEDAGGDDAGGDSGEDADAAAGDDAGEDAAAAEGDDGDGDAAPEQPAPEASGDDGGGEQAAAQQPEASASSNGGSDGDRVKASPVARRLANEQGISLDGLEGTGPGGRIVKADVESAAKSGGEQADGDEQAAAAEPEAQEEAPAKEAQPAAAKKGESGARGESELRELSRLQQVVARRMAESKATAPDFSITVEVDMEAAVALRREFRSADPQGASPSFNDFVIKASALALRDFPRANGAYRDGKFELYSRVNVGMAVAGQDALVVPTIFDADKKSLGEIARDAKTLARRVRDGKATPPELSGGTFTVSNLGMYGIKRFVAVINPPQAGILAVGALEPRPVVRDGEVQVRHLMELTLTCDHRILYGADAAEFLSKIRERLEQPLMLAL